MLSLFMSENSHWGLWLSGHGAWLSRKLIRVQTRLVHACGNLGCSQCFLPLILLEGGIQRLVFSDKDEKFRRSRVHVAHVKDT